MDKTGIRIRKTMNETMEKGYIDFSCNIPELKTIKIVQLDGKLQAGYRPDECLSGKIRIERTDEGVAIEVMDDVRMDTPLQILNLVGFNGETETSSLSSVKLGRNSRLKLIHCDDSYSDSRCSLSTGLKIELASDSSLDYYKLENVNDMSSVNTDVVFELGEGARLNTFGLSLNGLMIRNNFTVNFNREYGKADLNGLYLMDKQQSTQTTVNVYHKKGNCQSNQLFKGILDDSAKADFVGHVFVDYDASGTEAFQSSKNMLLTDKAKVNTRPFLEIYNDDVKCSHGATIGQLDDQALFYLSSRGIALRSAKLLLMYAFCQDVLSKSDIEELKESLGDLIKRRLQGELTACGNCVFQCSNPKFNFPVNPTKI